MIVYPVWKTFDTVEKKQDQNPPIKKVSKKIILAAGSLKNFDLDDKNFYPVYENHLPLIYDKNGKVPFPKIEKKEIDQSLISSIVLNNSNLVL